MNIDPKTVIRDSYVDALLGMVAAIQTFRTSSANFRYACEVLDDAPSIEPGEAFHHWHADLSAAMAGFDRARDELVHQDTILRGDEMWRADEEG